MNYRYVLDTCAWAEFFDGTARGRRVKEIVDEGNVATSIIALSELSDKCASENRDLEPFVSFIQAKAAVLPLTNEIAMKSGKLKKELRILSKNISLADSIHFQTAKDFGAAFVTGDPDFKELKLKGIMFLP